ncbi:AbiJ-NTD4 domain-containing protein [Latilactobacillus sakei]|uniref:AbiJ-NTD4 domain-containing protein n=1 Tax=Latilactobacillus sakei TaxID=1599 RepID=UPI003CFA3506
MIFSERMGLVDKLPMNTDSLSKAQKNDIFNFFANTFLEKNTPFGEEERHNNYKLNDILTSLFHVNITDIYHDANNNLSLVRRNIDRSEWYITYDFLEYVLENFSQGNYHYELANKMLESTNSGYCFIKKQLVSIVNKIDSKNIKRAVNKKLDDGHLSNALKEVSKRKDPNYKVVIKESIDAAEIVTKKIAIELYNDSNKKTLGQYVKTLESNGFIEGHNAFLKALSALYGYSSDGGIRHPKDDDIYDIDKSDAIFMLEVCSAFVSMLTTKYSELKTAN